MVGCMVADVASGFYTEKENASQNWIIPPCEPGSKLLVLGMVIQPLIGNPYNGYITPFYWVDDHPLLYGNIGSLDPSTCRGKNIKKNCLKPTRD